MGRPLTRPLLSALLYMSAALSVTTSGRFSRLASPRSWLIARDRFLAVDDPADARSWVRRRRQSCNLSSALSDLFDACALEMIVERFLSKAENLPGVLTGFQGVLPLFVWEPAPHIVRQDRIRRSRNWCI